MDSHDWWGRCYMCTPGPLSWAESQAAGKWLPAFPDGSGITQIISSNDVKKKNVFVQSCCNFHSKPVLQMARFLPSLALQGACLSVGLLQGQGWPVYSLPAGRNVFLTEQMPAELLLWVQAQDSPSSTLSDAGLILGKWTTPKWRMQIQWVPHQAQMPGAFGVAGNTKTSLYGFCWAPLYYIPTEKCPDFFCVPPVMGDLLLSCVILSWDSSAC